MKRMAKKAQLQASIRLMAEGSKSAFHTFYMGTSQYVYRNASLLYSDHSQVCQFMVDFYQYLYLHVPEYTPSTELKVWISRLIRARYDELSIGKDQQTPALSQQLESGNGLLSSNEQAHIWHQLEACMHFPAETQIKHASKPGILPAMILILILLALSAAWIFAPKLYSRLQSQPENQESPAKASDNDEPDDTADEDNITVEDLNDLVENAINQSTTSEALDTADFEDPKMNMQNAAKQSGQSKTKQDTTGSKANTSNDPDTNNTSNNRTNIEDLELELHYGDNLLPRGMLAN